jgi:hypothetical protein
MGRVEYGGGGKRRVSSRVERPRTADLQERDRVSRRVESSRR